MGNSEPVSIADEVPFEIPESWEWCRLGMLSTYAHSKKKINAKDADPDMWGLDLEDIEKGGRLISKLTVKERKAIGDKTFFEKGDILYSKLRPYLLKILMADEDGICTPEIVPFKVYGKIDSEYIVAYLKSPYVDSAINAATYGIKMPRAGTETMTSLLIPVPPLSEQNRIVQKLKELDPFIQKYDTCEQILAAINSEFPDLLKKSILQLVVQGKLVPQDPSDEPASVLLDRIQSEKERLIKAGKIKRDKNESVIFRRDNSHYEKRGNSETCIDDEIPFDLPDSWSWCRLKSICYDMRYGTAKKSTKTGQVAVLRMGNIQHGEIDYSNLVYSNDDTDNINFLLQAKDILFNRTNSRELVGKTGIYRGDIPAIFAGYLVLIRPIIIYPEYLNYVMNSHYEWSYCQNVRSDGINQSNVSASKIGEFLIPVPPLSEQKRIVNKLIDVLPLTHQNMRKFSL